MKKDAYQRRFYRGWVGAQGLHTGVIAFKETDLKIACDRPIDVKFVKERIKLYRRDIESYIAKDRRFLTALKPLAVELRARPIVKRMADAAARAGVGPMASVAGAIAEFIGGDLLRKGCKDVIVENGGDIFLSGYRSRKVGIYAGRKKIWNNLCLQIKKSRLPLGVCASSGTIGHSLSFGSSDAAVILARNTALADAVATATANRINSKEDLRRAVDFAKSVRGVSGALAIFGKNLVTWGAVKLCRK